MIPTTARETIVPHYLEVGMPLLRVTYFARFLCTSFGLMALLLSGTAYAEKAFFAGLEEIEGEVRNNSLYGLSADGLVAVGLVGAPRGSYRWQLGSGVRVLEQLPGALFHSARDVSGDGSVIVGAAHMETGQRAFLWSERDGLMDLGELPGGTGATHARGISRDGHFVVGWSVTEQGRGAFRWSAAEGMRDLGHIPGNRIAAAMSVSANGQTVVGDTATSLGSVAFRWTESSGMEPLGDLPGGSVRSKAWVVSDDGNTVGGWGTTELGKEAFLWTRERGMVGIGHLTTGTYKSAVRDLSADGSIAVGYSYTRWGPWPFVWDERHGMRQLQAVLMQDYGLDLGAWNLRYARAVSADGRTFAGYGTGPGGRTAAWIARIPPACDDGLDNDGDGRVDYPDDPGCRTSAWSEDPACDDGVDNDGDGGVDADGRGQAPPDDSCLYPWQKNEASPSACGLGFEIGGVLLLLAAWRRSRLQ